MELDTTKVRILEAAGTVFAQKGFENATVREICQLAGANVAAINYHFGDKQRLYVETMKFAHSSRAEQVPYPDWTKETPAEVRLTDFIRTMLTRMLGGGSTWHAQLVLREITRPNADCESLVRDYIRPQFELLLAILAELLPAETSTRERHLTAFSIVGQCLHYRAAHNAIRLLVSADEFASYDPESLSQYIAAFSLSALGHKSQRASSTAADVAPAGGRG